MRMTTRKLLLSTAVLLAGVGMASAQGKHEGAGAQQHGGAAAGISGGGPQAGAGASEHSHGHAGAQLGGQGGHSATVGAGGQAESHAHAPGGAQIEHGHGNASAQHNAQGHANARERHGTTGQGSRDENASRNAKQNDHAQGHANARERHGTTGQASRDENASRNAQQNDHANRNANARERHGTTGQGSREENASRNAQQNEQTRHQAQTPGRTTNGQGPNEAQGRANRQNRAGVNERNQAGANVEQNGGNRVELSSQQRTHIRERVLSRSNVPRVNRVDFALHAGVSVPRHVHYVSISDYPTLVDVFPEYRDDYFFVAEDQIVILTPQRRVVRVVPLSGSARVGSASASWGGVELSSTEVREVQQVLVDRGYDIQVDGVWGPSTRDALITFQRREGLPANGEITTRTVSSLGLKGRISGSHIEGGASTTGQGNVRENEGMSGRGNQPNMRQGQHRSDNQNANAPQRNRSTTGQGGNEPRKSRSNAQGNSQPLQNRSTTGQGNRHQPQDQSTNGQVGPQSRSSNGQGVKAHGHATTGQGSSSHVDVGGQSRGQGDMQHHMNRQK